MSPNFENMPDSSRIWIYQANRNFSEMENEEISQYLNIEINDWAAHGADLLAAFKIFHNRFVVIALDESQNAASGCSIDASTHWFKELGAEFGIDFFDRSLVYFSENELKSVEIGKIKNLVDTEIITANTLIFSNIISNLSDLKSNWLIEAGKAWTKRYFNSVTV